MPVVGFLHSGLHSPPHDGFRQGLNDVGFVEGSNVTIEWRYADGHYDRLPQLAADMARRVDVLGAFGAAHTAVAAKGATSTVPIVFAIGSDPVQFGLVASLNRPGSNLTGVSFFTAELEAKRLGLLKSLIPKSSTIGALINPTNANAQNQSRQLSDAARTLGVDLHIINVSGDNELDAVFANLQQRRATALLVASDPFLAARRARIVDLAARHAMPAIYEWREFVEEGGLASYGTNLRNANRQAGVYAGRIYAAKSRPSCRSYKQPNLNLFSISRPQGCSI